ncbi:hypothetical protein [Sphingomonas sp. Leaf21]|uniref:hypothetical protein n=1 Tax=Sphingomonas sp. Leaf21 TaxID=2876550 RepID=UPI001E4D21E8|nr:hypothetical protein [Sphingomonas sp. Leaf21]
MTTPVSRAIMALATAWMGDHRRSWSLAMQAEYAVAAEDGRALSFAIGCLLAAGREMVASAQGRLRLGGYALAVAVMLPMATLQIGCALLGFPFLFPGEHGLPSAMLVGGAHEDLLRGVYQGAVPSLALIQLATGIGHARLACLAVERDWSAAFRWSVWTLSAMIALVLLMTVLFLDSRQAVMQVAIVGLELAILAMLARRHGELSPPPDETEAGF